MPKNPLTLRDLSPTTAEFRKHVLDGLSGPGKRIASKYLYDERGSELFEQICELDEYYPTRTEISIMERHGPEMARLLGPRCMVVEPGAGAGTKTRMLLKLLESPVAYVPVEISLEFLKATAERLDRHFPSLKVLPVCADFMKPFPLPEPPREADRVVVYFPGSTIGNFTPTETRGFLRGMRDRVGPGGAILLGADLKKDVAVLKAAYDDREGVTAEFSLNLLARINRELDGTFNLDRFEHHVSWDPEMGAIVVHLRSLEDQEVRIGDETVSFSEGEKIHTEYCFKYDLDQLSGMAAEAGLRLEKSWTDPRRLFSVNLLTYRSSD